MADENNIVEENTEVEENANVQPEVPVTEDSPVSEELKDETPVAEEEKSSEVKGKKSGKALSKTKKKKSEKKANPDKKPLVNPDTKFGKVLLKIWGAIKRFGLCVWNGIKHIPYCGYCLLHPAEGFFRMKTDKRKQSAACAIILYVLLVISAIAKQQFTSYMFADTQAQLNLDIFAQIISTTLPYILWVISSWCFTSLMDGEGNLKDIFCATAAATIPMTIVNIILIPMSHLFTVDESNLYVFIGSLGVIITYAMLFLSMMFTQQYSVKKAIGTTLLTIVGMAVIAFVVILIFYLVQQVWGFITSVFSEITYRLNE